MYDFKPGLVYSFSVYPVAILGTGFENATVLSIMDLETAMAFEDVRQLHISVFPSLPAGTPNDPKSYNYLRLRLASGVTKVIGLAWIDNDSVELVEMQTITVKIPNVVSSDQVKIRNALAANGYAVIEMIVN